MAVSNQSLSLSGGFADDEVSYLYALQRSNLEKLGVDREHVSLRAFLDTAYLLIREDLALVMKYVVLDLQMAEDIMPLAMSLLDAYSVQGLTRNMELSALSFLVLTSRYEGQLPPVCLRVFIRSWFDGTKKVHAEKASTTAFALYEVKHHLMVMAAAVDWRLNRATADRFLRAFIGNGHGTGERDEADRIYEAEADRIYEAEAEAEEENCGRLVTASEWKTVRGWASYFGHLGVLHNLTYLHGESVLAAACIFAGRWKLNIRPLSTARLQELYGIVHEQDLASVMQCMQALLDVQSRPRLKAEYTFTDHQVILHQRVLHST